MTPLEACQRLGIDPNAQTHDEFVANWHKLNQVNKALATMEMTMRKALFSSTFPNPKEGVNIFEMPDGRKLKATHKINRSIDESQVALARSEYELLNDRPVEFDELLKVKYELVTSAFRKLEKAATDEGPAPAFVTASRMITAKPGSPSMELVV